jgi:hypothetical protein
VSINPPDVNYADHPPTIGELRSDRSDCASDWSPRDLLISVLREIDSGALNLDALVLVYRKRCESPNKVHRPGYRVATPDIYTTLGMLSAASFKLTLDSF